MTNYSAADLLDQLMGPNRNLAPGEKPKKLLNWSDPAVCKFYLCGFCPYELFINTKADLGNCPHVHEETLKQQYDASEDYGKLGYEESFLNFITKILNDCEKKIARGYDRLRNRKPIFHDPSDKEAYDKLNDKISVNLRKIEEMGSKGMVEEATYAMQNVEDLKCELNMIVQRAISNSRFGYDREMEVCAVCGSLTLVNDLPSRFEDHLNGRQHMGYSKIRQQVKLMNEDQYWKEKKPDIKEEPEEGEKPATSPKRRRSRSKDRKSHRHSDRKRGRSRSRSRSRSPKHHRRSDKKSKSPHRSRRYSPERSRKDRRG
ncbi:hypothetical protein HZS_2249 [Henneguya salminicola]|nr:hypothetical protein HZS_2249 [Henneguya salminicola]